MAPRSTLAALLAGITPLTALAVAAPADAAERWLSRSTSQGAYAEWVEYGELPGGVGGNVHVGYLEAETSSDGGNVWGKVIDYACDPGEVPGGGGHGEHLEPLYDEEPTNKCDFVSKRFMDGGDVTFTVDRKLGTARLTGTLFVDNHGASATPPVDMTWTGIGDTSSSVYYEKYEEGGSTYYWKYESTRRDAAVTGFIGPMGFTDDADDESWGSIYRSKSFERGSSR